MNQRDWLARRFEMERPHLRAVAYRMLGSPTEADDAVQESWLRLSRADTSAVENLSGWLTTVVARICLDMLRARETRREEPLGATDAPIAAPGGALRSLEGGTNPEDEALLADSVGMALLVVLDTLTPAERLAFVLHDLFDISFEEIAPIVGRSPVAARQLASRARRRVRGQGAEIDPDTDLTDQHAVVDAFLAAAREGNFDALLAALDPDIVFHGDQAALAIGSLGEVRGAAAVAKLFMGRARGARVAVIDGALGLVVSPRGPLLLVLELAITRGKIAEIYAVADPASLARLDITMA